MTLTEIVAEPPAKTDGMLASTTEVATGATTVELRVVLTTGSSGAFLLAFLAAFEPGDRVALASPSYPAYRNILTAIPVINSNDVRTSINYFLPINWLASLWR